MASPMDSKEVDPTDPYLREAQTFPRLTDEMSRRVAAFGIEEEVGDVNRRGILALSHFWCSHAETHRADVSRFDRVQLVSL